MQPFMYSKTKREGNMDCSKDIIEIMDETEKIIVDKICVVANLTNPDKPYYCLLYHEIDADEDIIGYGSYSLVYVLMWKEQYFKVENDG